MKRDKKGRPIGKDAPGWDDYLGEWRCCGAQMPARHFHGCDGILPPGYVPESRLDPQAVRMGKAVAVTCGRGHRFYSVDPDVPCPLCRRARSRVLR